MATHWVVKCPKCECPVIKPRSLFNILKRIAGMDVPWLCDACKVSLEAQIVLDFGVGAPKKQSVILAAFLPEHPSTWDNKGKQTIFYPFLVILKHDDNKQAIWLPYWHTEADGNKKRLKYGQWAPCIGSTQFNDLLRQAHKYGYLKAANSL